MKRHQARIERITRLSHHGPIVRLFYLQEDGTIESNGEVFTREQYENWLHGGDRRAILDDIVPVLFDEAARGV